MVLAFLFVIIFVAIGIFYYSTQKRRARRDVRNERLREKREEWMESMFRKGHKNVDDNSKETDDAD